MKKIRLFSLLLAILLLIASCTGESENEDETEMKNECESAAELAEKIKIGWNLGDSLSVYSESNCGAVLYFISDGSYSRSNEVFTCEDIGVTGELVWNIAEDNTAVTALSDGKADNVGIEIWNFGLDERTTVSYEISGYTVITEKGEYEITGINGKYSSDMGGGTCGSGVSPEIDIVVGDIKQIRASLVIDSITKAVEAESYEDVIKCEESWDNPATTPEMIRAVCDRGFNFIRVQVSFFNHIDEEGNISEAFMKRLDEVVGYCIDAGVYVSINTTGMGWLTADASEYEYNAGMLKKLWSQIAKHFSDTGEMLVFECFNEILDSTGVWSNPSDEAYETVNKLYQVFVDTVRASGGYNTTRNLMLLPYAASYLKTDLDNLSLPDDSVTGHLLVQVHCYEPIRFCFNEINLGSTDFTWEWGTDEEKENLENIMIKLKLFSRKNNDIPVVIGEFGVCDRTAESERAEYMEYYVQTAKKYGIKTIVFDDGGEIVLFDREKLSWLYPSVTDALFKELGIE